jgi:hypothetical protein
MSGSKLAGFAVGAAAVLTPLSGSPFESGAVAPTALDTDSAGQLFTSHPSNQLRAFVMATGALTGVTNNPFPAGLDSPVNGLVHPNGLYLVADRIGNRVGVYRISGSGMGTHLTPVTGSPFASGGVSTNSLALNETRNILFAAHGDSRNVTSFGVDVDAGVLEQVAALPPDSMGTSGQISGMAYAPATAPPGLSDGGVPDGGSPDGGDPVGGTPPDGGDPTPQPPASCHCTAVEGMGALPLALSGVLLRLATRRRRSGART